jgi:hypothetical protein
MEDFSQHVADGIVVLETDAGGPITDKEDLISSTFTFSYNLLSKLLRPHWSVSQGLSHLIHMRVQLQSPVKTFEAALERLPI